MTGHPHAHPHPQRHEVPGRAAAALAQRDATVIGWVEGVPVPRERLDARFATLRRGPYAAGLPVVGSSEDRQFVRWTAHVLFTEELCRTEARRQDLPPGPDQPAPLDAIGAVQLGSINTAAWRSCPEVAAVFSLVVPPEEAQPAAAGRRWWRVSYAVAGDAGAAAEAPLRPIGWSTLGDLPPPLARRLRQTPLGVRLAPVPYRGNWHAARVEATEVRAERSAGTPSGERLRAYARWLDARRAAALRPAPGFEHPGDPAQPDHTHRH